MARTNLAYKQEKWLDDYHAEAIPLPRPKLRTIEGQGRGVQTRTRRSPLVSTLVVTTAIVMVALATVSVVRISIANSTVQMMQTAEQTRSAINQARAQGLELEVRHSLANNPTRIQDLAAAMGILPGNQPSTLAARDGFSEETIIQMQTAADEARAAELALLLAAIEPTQELAALDYSATSASGQDPTRPPARGM